MDAIPSHFHIRLDSAANPAAVVQEGQARFTVLAPRMMRMEWSPSGVFEERASQAFWFRNQAAPAFQTHVADGSRIIETEALRLVYYTGRPFTPDTLRVEIKETGAVWNFGDPDPLNLGGTARTVDGIDGATPLSLGLVSRAGWSVVDDSASLVFNEIGWLEPREAVEGQLDLYFLGYGHDYLGCLRDFNRVSGAVPMIPRFVLGNWWSRYWKYREADLHRLILDFETHQVPLSVCIIDMDWHITETGNDSSGWTGYTWNQEYFPDPERMLAFLHEHGLKVALNLHPADGVHRHEEMYAEMAEAIGQDPAEGAPVEFDIANPRFVEAYFRILHHRQEARGVDFWWMDWQQGVRTRLSGLDPLWWLNHLHFLDLGRDGKRRSFIFSRWGGLGNHRYPIGFSGDSVVSWASLAFQPYFTATSSNVNYGWWSHDIGGHMGGVEDAELYARWVQLGAFQPVLRLHSTNNPFHERRPWGFDAETFAAARYAMQLRHALIPYLYSMAWRFHKDSVPPILPMYYGWPEEEAAYACPNQYMFGNQLVVAPFIAPCDADTRLSRAAVWLPQGDWYHFFTGQYAQGGWQATYGTLQEIPVFAKAGAIVPQGPMAGQGNVETPNHLIVNVFPGADGAFDLYEDESNTNDYLDGAYAITPMRLAWSEARAVLRIGPAEGDPNLLPAARQLDLRFRGFYKPARVEVLMDGAPVAVEQIYDDATSTLFLPGLTLSPAAQVEVRLLAEGDLSNRADSRLAAVQKLLHHFRMETWTKARMAVDLEPMIAEPSRLGRFLPHLTESQMRAMMETLTGAGVDITSSTGEPLVVVWNNHADEGVQHVFALSRLQHFWMYKDHNPWSSGTLPRFQPFRPKTDFGSGNPWTLVVDYYGIGKVTLKGA
jgi:hypothetical protein